MLHWNQVCALLVTSSFRTPFVSFRILSYLLYQPCQNLAQELPVGIVPIFPVRICSVMLCV